MRPQSSDIIARTSTILTAIISLLIAVFIPAGYYMTGYQYLGGGINSEIEYFAQNIEKLIANNPDTWQFEEIRIAEILARDIQQDNLEKRVLADRQGAIIAQTDSSVSSPALTVRHPIYDAGTHVAFLEVRRSLFPLLTKTAAIGVLSVLTGFAVFFLFRSFPLGAVRKAYRSMEESENKYHELTDFLPQVIFETDREGNLTYVNRMGFRQFNYSREDCPEKLNAFDMIAPQERTEALKRAAEVINGKQETGTELLAVKRGGTPFPALVYASPIFREGRIAGIRGTLIDITDRKKMEQERQESERRYRSLVENASDIVIRTDGAGNIVYVNPAGIRAAEYGEEELIGRNYTEFIRPDMRDGAVRFFGRQFVKGLDNTYTEFPVITKKGHELWFGQNTQMIREDGQVIGFQAIILAITQRKKIIEALRRSEARYDRLARQSQTFTWEVDAQGLYTYVSPVSETVLGYLPEELVGRMHFYDLHPEDGRDEFKNTALTVFACREPFRGLENAAQTKDGRRIWLVTNGLPVLNADGTLRGYHGSDTDITTRKQAEEAWQESERKYRTLVESTHDFVFMVDRRGMFTYVNPNFEKVAGYSLADLQGRPFTTVISPEEREMIVARFKSGVHGARGVPVVPYETELLAGDGKRVAVEFLASNLYDAQGKVTGRFGVGRDITKRKEAEAQLLESEKKYRELSITDNLTQLYNSRYFFHQVQAEIDRANRYQEIMTLILLDLDDFKNYNDAYGHIEGDAVLMRLGQVVKRCLRKTDSAYRYGGEEFTIILPMTACRDAVVIAERIRMEFKKDAFSPEPDREVRVTLSAGVGQYRPREDMKEFVQRVDQQMYRAKNSGKDRVCCDSGS